MFTAVFALQWRSTREGVVAKPHSNVKLEPDRLAKSLSEDQRRDVELALRAAVSDVAIAVDVPDRLVRANLFARVAPNRTELAMVKNLWHHMDSPAERTIRMEIGRGSTGNAWARQRANLVVWKDGWGEDDMATTRS